jgi:hypothetical protein
VRFAHGWLAAGMTKIHVDTEELNTVARDMLAIADELDGCGRDLLRAAAGAPSYDGQYGPWLAGLASESDHDLRLQSRWFRDNGQWLLRTATAFAEADMAEKSGYAAWAAVMREMVEQGLDPMELMPDWLRRLQRPPWISAEMWAALPPGERAETLRGLQEQWLAQQERISRMRTPPWEKDPGWLMWLLGMDAGFEGRLGRANPDDVRDHQVLMERTRKEYQELWEDFLASQSVYKFGVGNDLTEAFLIYLFGLEGAGGYGVGPSVSPGQWLLERPAFQGSIGTPAQSINLGDPELPFTNYRYGHVHPNLCGELTVAVTLGLDPTQALVIFEGLEPNRTEGILTDGAAILADRSMGTSARNLSDFMKALGWTGEPIGFAGDTQVWAERPPTMEEVGERLRHGQAVIALVSLDTRSTYLTASDVPNDAAHWVSILQALKTRSGEEIVRVYNPYMNREEWYAWQELQDSWQLGSKLDRSGDALGPNFRGVIGTPPSMQSWLPTP